MKFGTVALSRAVGHLLAHSTGGLKKGTRLTEEHLASLSQRGVQELVTAELEPGDTHEDEAATTIGRALTGTNAYSSPAHTGRVNIHASADGLIDFDEASIHRINALHESVTVATMRRLEPAEAGQIIATVKIIPFASPDWVVKCAGELAEKNPLRIRPYTANRVALISTRLPGLKPSVIDKTRNVTAQRLRTCGAEIVSEATPQHNPTEISQALTETLKANPDLVLIIGASATTDRADAIPEAIQTFGGDVLHFGMPVDPGNLLVLAEIQNKPVIVVPGCARSPKLNGFDFVLQRLCAGVSVSSKDIQAMGVGGLLKEIPSRPQPRAAHGQHKAATANIAAIVLAAGRSSRMQGRNKLLLPISGMPLIRRTTKTILDSNFDDVKVVTGFESAQVKAALEGLPVQLVENKDFASGMSSSLIAGLNSLKTTVDAALICLADMPALTPNDIAKIRAAFDPELGRTIVVPVFQGKRGNPVLFGRDHFDEIKAIQGDTGARQVIQDNANCVFEVEMDTAAILADADTPEAFDALKAVIDPNE